MTAASRIQNRLLPFVFIIIVAVVAIVAVYWAYPRVISTSVADVNAGVRVDPTAWNRRQVTIYGIVVDRGTDSMEIADGTGTIDVVWSGTIPAVGTANILVRGVLDVDTFIIGDTVVFQRVQLIATNVDAWLF